MMIGAAILPVMFYAGYKDIKYRIIPDRVQVLLFLISLSEIILLNNSSIFYISVSERVAGLLPALILLIMYMLGREVGGGDFKIIAAAGFCMGIHGIMVILSVSCFGGVLATIFKKEKSIPLAAYMAVGTVVYYLLISIS